MLRPVHCARCNRVFFRPTGRYNEAVKFNWKQYCCDRCQSEAKNKQITFHCHRPGCGKTFKRGKRDFLKYGVAYCSHRCFALVSNKERPRWLWKVKKCAYCGKSFRRNKKYCSPNCQHKDKVIDKGLLLENLKNFIKQEERIPVKREFPHYSAIRNSFGTWNNFIKSAGLKPNPVLFANKHIAKDGHKCDSFSEKIIDDWLFARRIEHKRSVSYPTEDGFTADFLINPLRLMVFIKY